MYLVADNYSAHSYVPGTIIEIYVILELVKCYNFYRDLVQCTVHCIVSVCFE